MTAQQKRMTQILNRITFVLSLFGVGVALYVLQSWLRQAPIVCVSGGCETVRKSAASYPFGIPVPLFGLIGYTLLALFSFLRTMNFKQKVMKTFLTIMLGVGIFGVLFVSWFTYTELFIIHGVCMWCAISAVNMGLIFLLVLKWYMLEQR